MAETKPLPPIAAARIGAYVRGRAAAAATCFGHHPRGEELPVKHLEMLGALALEQAAQIRLGEKGYAGLLRLRELRGARLLADDEARRLAGDRVGDLGSEGFERRLRLLARVPLERSRDDVCVAGERAFDRPFHVSGLEAQTKLTKLLNERPVVTVLEPLGDRLGPVGAYPLDLLDVVHARVEQAIDVAEMTREVACRHPADIRDVETEQHP